MGVYWAIAVRSFRRFSTYRIATVSGVFTNSVFGFILCGVYLTLWRERPGLGGYDVPDALTFVWLQQGMLAPVGIFGATTTNELGERVRSGEIAVDLYRPTQLLLWWLSVDFGRAAFQLLARGGVPMVVGALVFDLKFPSSVWLWPVVVLGLVLGILVSFTIRYLVALSGFWITDSRGMEQLALVLSLFFAGTILPLVAFPGWIGVVARATPWAATMQVPIDIWLGRNPGGTGAALLFQVGWLLVLLLTAQLITTVATRKVVIHGG
ncbi:ABC-2 type transport system permease protein [Kribbella aluminosa]|uniref:ABC-2 type transport system permease protein n=1 Tax=Kribbella aluminosa TaxID=416017 RepID=A0ABS4UFL3_9ACTN|nr:ABC-2 family transporter protein [Kribbella aluminosa]MBP2350432.1 ABC-2 type transport system permease protein [Kribbella aluminosa]